jgi:hypothetical protein
MAMTHEVPTDVAQAAQVAALRALKAHAHANDPRGVDTALIIGLRAAPEESLRALASIVVNTVLHDLFHAGFLTLTPDNIRSILAGAAVADWEARQQADSKNLAEQVAGIQGLIRNGTPLDPHPGALTFIDNGSGVALIGPPHRKISIVGDLWRNPIPGLMTIEGDGIPGPTAVTFRAVNGVWTYLLVEITPDTMVCELIEQREQPAAGVVMMRTAGPDS